jgi:hypothetical protein
MAGTKMETAPVAPGSQAVQPALAAPATAPATTAMATPPTKAQQESWFGLHLFGGRKAPQTTPTQFGSETLAAKEKPPETNAPQEIENITATVTDYATTPYGKIVVFLDNGQVWRQPDSDTGTVHMKKVNKVEISRAIFNSYSMMINKRPPVIKVVRVK